MTATIESRLPAIVAGLRLARTDTHSVEVKASVGRLPKSMPETLSAFANGSGGLVILGLDEANGFVPAKGFRASSMRDALAGACSDRMHPPLRPAIEMVSFEGANVVVAEIEALIPADKPCFVKERGMYQGSYIRTGDGDHRLSQYEIDRLVEEHRQPRWDEEIVEDASFADFDQALVAPVVTRQQRLRPQLYANGSAESVLQGLQALKADARGILRPTLGGLLALGTNPQYYFPRLNVTFSSFPGTSKSVIMNGNERLLDSQSFVGPIPTLVRDVVAAVLRNSRVAGRMEGVFRKEIPEYPVLAVREAVTNALMHRDYSPLARGTQVQVNLYTDHLEILNPGGLYGTVTVPKLGSRGLSSARNQRLSTLLEEIPYPEGGIVAENRGTGYLLIESLLSEAGMPPPDPDDDISSFSLIFHAFSSDSAPPPRPTEPSKDVIEAFLKATKQATSAEVAEATGLSRSAVNNHLKTLTQEGRLQPTHPGRSRYQQYRWIG
jgi:ATP-dependent DNA helicase RecG